MAELLSMLSQIAFVALNGIFAFCHEAFVNTPFFMLMFGIFFLGACIGIFGRLLSHG